MKNAPATREIVQHAAAGFTLLISGLANVAHFPVIGYSITGLGVVVIVYLVFLRIKGRSAGAMKAMIFFAEAMALLLAAYVSYKAGKIYLPYLILAAAIGYFIAFIVFILRNKKRNEASPPTPVL